MQKEKKEFFSCEDIEEVRFEDLGFHNTIWLHFRYGKCRYEVNVRNDGPQHYNIYHEREVDKLMCPFCADRTNHCSGLSQVGKEITDYLLHHPNVRMRWLFQEKS